MDLTVAGKNSRHMVPSCGNKTLSVNTESTAIARGTQLAAQQAPTVSFCGGRKVRFRGEDRAQIGHSQAANLRTEFTTCSGPSCRKTLHSAKHQLIDFVRLLPHSSYLLNVLYPGLLQAHQANMGLVQVQPRGDSHKLCLGVFGRASVHITHKHINDFSTGLRAN